MTEVFLIEEDNHNIKQYLASVQEPFMIVTLGDRSQARKFYYEDALQVIEKIKRVYNGHRKFRPEFV